MKLFSLYSVEGEMARFHLFVLFNEVNEGSSGRFNGSMSSC